MNLRPPPDSASAIAGEQGTCGVCHTVSRLTNGLCLNCLLRGALERETIASARETFKEVLAGVKSGDGDWRIAEHEILDEIARGGMGVVYQAREPHSGRIVALKCVLAYQGDSDHVIARFRREAETAARLEHPNIVPIYQVGETADGFPFYTMKYAAAGSLLQARGPLRQHPRQSATLMVKVARAVQYAHAQGVLHRDLKPGNVLLDSHGEPLVSDFGLARCEAVSSYLTRSLSSFGTPGYIAPEQADGPAARLTAAADIYSLGAILFELLTGRTPFVGDNAFAVMKQSAEGPAPKLRSLVPKADRDLEIICARCLEREPGDRYQSAGALADDLQAWLDDRPIAASAPGVVLRTRRWVGKNRTLAASLAALALLGLGSVAWQIRAQKIEMAFEESHLTARSVVILPFFDLDTVNEDPVVTQWVTDSLAKQFQDLGSGRVRTSAVPGRSKVEDVQRAVREAKGRTALTGTVRNVDGKRHISLRLLDPAGGQTLFAAVADQSAVPSKSPGKKEDWGRGILKILDTNDWSEVLDTGADPGMRDEGVSEAMTSARAWMSTPSLANLDKAIVLLKRAVAKEPNSAIAHAYLAMASSSRVHLVADRTYLELAKSEAFNALALEPGLVEAHRALAGVYYQEGKFSDALEGAKRTIEMGGVQERVAVFTGTTLDMLGRPDLSLKWYKVASNLQKSPAQSESLIGDSWSRLVEDDRAFRAYERAMELQSANQKGAVGKCHLLLLRGEFETAREIARTHFRSPTEFIESAQMKAQIEFLARNYAVAEELYTNLARNDADGGGSFYGAMSYQSALGRIRQALGAREEGSRLLRVAHETETANLKRQPDHPEVAYRLAAIEASLDLPEAALGHLRQATAAGWLDYRSLEKDPRFDSLSSNPEFANLIDELSAKVADLRAKAERK